MTDNLVSLAFRGLRQVLFDKKGEPRPLRLPDKAKTQDDPFDRSISQQAFEAIDGVECLTAGPNTNPDMVLIRPSACKGASREDLRDSLDRVFAIEVKKLNRTKTGPVARASGLDYNSTPPCSHVTVWDKNDTPVKIRGFYLFACLEDTSEGESIVTALALVDGHFLNSDEELYDAITGEREKNIGLGTYGDGMDRERPMLVFANPLGASELDHAVTLVVKSGTFDETPPALAMFAEIHRVTTEAEVVEFDAYRLAEDLPEHEPVKISQPLPTPRNRSRTTSRRGAFPLPLDVPED